MKTVNCKFKDIAVNTDFFAFLNPNKPLHCHGIPCHKNGDGSVKCVEFSNLTLHPDEPVYYYVK